MDINEAHGKFDHPCEDLLRQTAKEFNFGELFGMIAFGFQNPKTLNFIEPDPRFGTFSLSTITQDWVLRTIDTKREYEMDTVNPSDHPGFFPDDMSPVVRASLPALEGLYTPKNPSEIILRDNFGSNYGI